MNVPIKVSHKYTRCLRDSLVSDHDAGALNKFTALTELSLNHIAETVILPLSKAFCSSPVTMGGVVQKVVIQLIVLCQSSLDSFTVVGTALIKLLLDTLKVPSNMVVILGFRNLVVELDSLDKPFEEACPPSLS